MNTMNIPGFTAEDSLYKSDADFRLIDSGGPPEGAVYPAAVCNRTGDRFTCLICCNQEYYNRCLPSCNFLPALGKAQCRELCRSSMSACRRGCGRLPSPL